MGTGITDWAAVEGAYYTGAGGGEMIWTIVAIALCIVPLFVGARHEHAAYRKLRK